MLLLASLLVLFNWTPVPGPILVRGLVIQGEGVPVSGAVVHLVSTDSIVISNPDGHFALEVPTLPALIRASHPKFGDTVLEVTSEEPVQLELRPVTQPVDEVVVTARLTPERFVPAGAVVSEVEPSIGTGIGGRVAEHLATVPGVALSGQGGQFQVYSVRGMSRARILTSLEGARLTSERRAGVSASFIDPYLIGELNVLRGASSTHYGSGAMGGAIDLQLRRFSGGSVAAGWGSQGNESYLASGWGDDRWSIAMAVRRSDDTSDPQGETINSHFKQFSAALIREWSNVDRRVRLLIVPSYAADIGKANSDYPSRVTEYPLERHLLVKFGVSTKSLLTVEAFVHPQDAQTLTWDSEVESEVENQSFDFGFRSAKEVDFGTYSSVRLGIDYFGRRGVTAEESELILATGESASLDTLDGALEDEFGAQISGSILAGRSIFEAGGRLLMLRQANRQSSVDFYRLSGTGFANLLIPLGDRLQLSASLGSGVRFPTLGERYFTGTTGRGEIVANSQLNPERSIDLEAGMRWGGARLFAAGNVFRKWIDNYIERVELSPDVYTFTNLTNGTISGIEWEAAWVPAGIWRPYARGHLMRGRDSQGFPLADIPVHRLNAGFEYVLGRWRKGFEIELLGGKGDPGDGEKTIGGAHPVRGFIGFKLAPDLEISAAVTNLFDENFFATADRKSMLEPGRSIRVVLSWQRE